MAALPTWEELLGSNEWEGLLDPLDLSLRKFILRCGDLNQATYDAFISNIYSKYCGCSRYGMKSLFQKVFLADCASDYTVVAFLYATAISTDNVSDAFLVKPKYSSSSDVQRQSNWIGYIAVTTDQVSKVNGRREVYVAWRGTIRPLEKADDGLINLVPATPLMAAAAGIGNHDAKVMQGWLTIYTSSNPEAVSPIPKDSAQTQVLNKIGELMEQYKDEKLSLIFTGHSLGGALAALSAFNVVEKLGVGDHVKVAAFVFGCPMLGNKVFCDKLKAVLPILHVKNGRDLVTNYPGLLTEGYAYAGIELPVDSNKSPFLKTCLSSDTPHYWHNLQGLLHVVAGWNGMEGKFELKVKRSVGLVNKSSNFLKDEQVPAHWRIEKNKGMVLDKNGDWVEAKPFQDD